MWYPSGWLSLRKCYGLFDFKLKNTPAKIWVLVLQEQNSVFFYWIYWLVKKEHFLSLDFHPCFFLRTGEKLLTCVILKPWDFIFRTCHTVPVRTSIVVSPLLQAFFQDHNLKNKKNIRFKTSCHQANCRTPIDICFGNGKLQRILVEMSS